MQAVRSMIHDWAFWFYLALAVVTLASVGALYHQQADVMRAHRRAQVTLESVVRRSVTADAEHRVMEREIRDIEAKADEPK